MPNLIAVSDSADYNFVELVGGPLQHMSTNGGKEKNGREKKGMGVDFCTTGLHPDLQPRFCEEGDGHNSRAHESNSKV